LVHRQGADMADDDFDLAVIERSVRRFRRKDRQVTIAMATYEGHLEITDAAA
jgi:CRISPR system Cascade subunit CasE